MNSEVQLRAGAGKLELAEDGYFTFLALWRAYDLPHARRRALLLELLRQESEEDGRVAQSQGLHAALSPACWKCVLCPN